MAQPLIKRLAQRNITLKISASAYQLIAKNGFDPEYGLSKMEPGHLDYKYSDDGEWCDFKYTYLCLEEDTASRIESKFKRSFEFDGDMKIEYGVKHKKITGANVDTLFAGSYRHTKYSFKAHPYHRISGRVKVKWVTNIAR